MNFLLKSDRDNSLVSSLAWIIGGGLRIFLCCVKVFGGEEAQKREKQHQIGTHAAARPHVQYTK